ncbi:predicted protein [Botrytis cinerea T4]|uniref:Uncharacterized protein n=1 Tax=Botryotinia fuckeliana (strain T4) TaxID=999810 RepID=G2Y1K4_BOTF4|nr:predicted protein [Botrytis cinerea T4]
MHKSNERSRHNYFLAGSKTNSRFPTKRHFAVQKKQKAQPITVNRTNNRYAVLRYLGN